MLYLLHSTVRLGTVGRNSAEHYVGTSEPEHLQERLHQHRIGHSGVKIIAAYLRAGGSLLLTGLWLEGGTEDEIRVKKHGHLEERCAYCIAQKKGLVWSPAIVRLNQLPKLRPKPLREPQKEDGGLASSSTLAAANGPSRQHQTQNSPAPSPSTILTYLPVLGGNVSGAIAPPARKG